jgi:hypothetical protein
MRTSSTSGLADLDPDQMLFINLSLLDTSFSMKYARSERWGMVRGGGEQVYYCPSGWERIGVFVPNFDEVCAAWPVAYHGTSTKWLVSILEHGLQCPGTALPGGLISPQHGTVGSTGQTIFLSQSIEYAVLYADELTITTGGRVKHGMIVLQVRVRPGSFRTQGITVDRHWPGELRFDEYHANNQLEWLVENPQNVVIYGVMFRATKETKPMRIAQRKQAAQEGWNPSMPMAFSWQWFDTRRMEFVPYPVSIQLLLEETYKRANEPPYFHIPNNPFGDDDSTIYTIDFATMQQRKHHDDRTAAPKQVWRTIPEIQLPAPIKGPNATFEFPQYPIPYKQKPSATTFAPPSPSRPSYATPPPACLIQ